MDAHGKKLGRIAYGAAATTNLAFGGEDWKTLYFTSRNHLGAVNVKIPGIPVPPPRKARRFLSWRLDSTSSRAFTPPAGGYALTRLLQRTQRPPQPSRSSPQPGVARSGQVSRHGRGERLRSSLGRRPREGRLEESWGIPAGPAENSEGQ
jgi:hypothetical protein